MLKVAATEVAAVRVKLHVDVPVQGPDQPANVVPELGVAVNATDVPLAKSALQVTGQLMPEGVLTIVPVPVPGLRTVSRTGATAGINVAVADALALRSNLQVEVPLQAPDHCENLEPDFGVAVSVTVVPVVYSALQVVPHLMPVGLLVIVPAPLPALWTAS